MSDPDRHFFGRRTDLSWVTRQVETAKLDRPYPPVILIHGPAGIGKTALIDAWVGESRIREGKVAWLRTTESPRAETLAAFVERLARSADAREAALRAGANSVAVGIAAEAAAVESGNAPTAYTPKGTVRPVRLDAEVGIGSGEGRLAENLRRRLQAWLCGPGGRAAADAKPLLVVILDRFDRYPPPFRTWLGRDLLPALGSGAKDWSCAFLLTGALSWNEGRQDAYWNVPAEARFERELGPLLIGDCVEWLRASGREEGRADDFFEESEGVPARFAALLSAGFSEESEETAEKRPAVLASLSARERRWVQAGCFHDECTRETLGILLGGEEGVRAFDWLVSHFGARIEPGAEATFRIREKHREEVRAWMRETMAYRWHHFRRQTRNYEQLRRVVPDAEDRTTLAQIAPIRFFTPELVEKLLAGNE